MREIILDTETTGLDPEEGHRIVEIGCIEMVNKKRTDRVFHCYVNPQRNMPQKAYEIHGLSEEFLKDKPKFSEIAKDFRKFIDGAKIVAHNAWFDVKFINHEFKRLDYKILEPANIIDTLLIARQKFPGLPASLDVLCDRFMIDRTMRTKHGALLDAELLADIYLILITGSRQSKMELDVKTAINLTLTKREFRPARGFSISEEELKVHYEFMSNIKNPIWNNLSN